MKEALNKFMEEKIDELVCDPTIKQAIKYSLINDGKLIRPLIFLSYLEVDDISDYYDLAMSIECIHTYSLIHDDLPAMDDDEFRRGKKTLHLVYGEDMAILAGDSLLTLAFELITNNKVISDSQKVKLINILANYSGVNQGMINGQVIDIKGEINNLEVLDQMYMQKTAKLLIAPMLMANVISNLNYKDKLIVLGTNLGLIYQIQDDYLDCYGSFETVGKDIGSDIANDKFTYATYYSKEELEEVINNKLKDIDLLISNLKLNQNFIDLISTIYHRSS